MKVDFGLICLIPVSPSELHDVMVLQKGSQTRIQFYSLLFIDILINGAL